MEEHDVSLLHLQVYLLTRELLLLLYAEVGFVHLPLGWVGVVVETSFVGFRENVKTAVLDVAVLKGSPGSDYFVGGSEGEVGQILVEGVPGGVAHEGRLIDEHGVDGLDVVAAEAAEVGEEVGVGAVGLQDLVELEVLDLGDVLLPDQLLVVLLVLLGQRDVPDDLHSGQAEWRGGYGSRVRSQYCRKRAVHWSMSACFRKSFTTMYPFSS